MRSFPGDASWVSWPPACRPRTRFLLCAMAETFHANCSMPTLPELLLRRGDETVSFTDPVDRILRRCAALCAPSKHMLYGEIHCKNDQHRARTTLRITFVTFAEPRSEGKTDNGEHNGARRHG